MSISEDILEFISYDDFQKLLHGDLEGIELQKTEIQF